MRAAWQMSPYVNYAFAYSHTRNSSFVARRFKLRLPLVSTFYVSHVKLTILLHAENVTRLLYLFGAFYFVRSSHFRFATLLRIM